MANVWINGIESLNISAFDRGLAYGDGVFETLRFEQGKVLLLDQHVARMELGLKRLKFPANTITQLLDDFAKLSHSSDGFADDVFAGKGCLKWLVTRGENERGYALPIEPKVTRIISITPIGNFDLQREQGVTARLCDYQLSINPVLAQIKHCNRVEQVLARSEWSDASISEGILTDVDGYVVEGTMSNIFWVKDRVLYTPTIDRCGVKGVMRDWVMMLFSNNGMRCQEGRYGVDELLNADEVFLTNSLIEVWPVAKIAEHCFGVGPITKTLLEWIELTKC